MSPENAHILGSEAHGDQGHESQKHCRRGYLHSCECWLLIVFYSVAFTDVIKTALIVVSLKNLKSLPFVTSLEITDRITKGDLVFIKGYSNKGSTRKQISS